MSWALKGQQEFTGRKAGDGESHGLGKCNARVGGRLVGSEVGSREGTAGDQRYGKGSGGGQVCSSSDHLHLCLWVIYCIFLRLSVFILREGTVTSPWPVKVKGGLDALCLAQVPGPQGHGACLEWCCVGQAGWPVGLASPAVW